MKMPQREAPAPARAAANEAGAQRRTLVDVGELRRADQQRTIGSGRARARTLPMVAAPPEGSDGAVTLCESIPSEGSAAPELGADVQSEPTTLVDELGDAPCGEADAVRDR